MFGNVSASAQQINGIRVGGSTLVKGTVVDHVHLVPFAGGGGGAGGWVGSFHHGGRIKCGVNISDFDLTLTKIYRHF